MRIMADFQVREPSLLEYSIRPLRTDYTHPDELQPYEEVLKQQVADGKLDQRVMNAYQRQFCEYTTSVLARFLTMIVKL